MNNFDLNKILSIISKMDKNELEENISKAKSILEKNDNLNSFNNLDDLSKLNDSNKQWGNKMDEINKSNEDYSDLIKNFSNILKEKNIDLNRVLSKNEEPDDSNFNYSENQTSSLDFNFEDIIKIKHIFESINNQKNSDTNTLLNSLKPFLPNYKKEKLETLIKISTIITALDLFENKKILGLTLNSNLILIIILILIIL